VIGFLAFLAEVCSAEAGFATLLSADLSTQHLSAAALALDTVLLSWAGTSCCYSMSECLHSPT